MITIFRQFYSFFILAFVALFLTSCFDLKEEVTINKDGSGSFIQTIDLGNNPMMQMALNMESDSSQNEEKRMNKMDSTLAQTKEKLSKVKGISNIKTASSTEGLKYTVMYDFANVDALNAALNAAKEKKEGEVQLMQKQYSFKKGEFTRINAFSMGNDKMDLSTIMGGKEDGKEQTEGEKEQMKQMMTMFFNGANYTYIVHVPNQVKSYSNKENTTISEDKKTLTMTIPFLDLMEEEKKIDAGNSVKFK